MARSGLIILLLAAATCLGQESADDKAYEGNGLYKKGDFAGAVKQYEEAKKLQPNRLAIDFNIGNAYYRQKKYAKAAETHKTASGSENPLLSAESRYNIGNSRYREGQVVKEAKPDKTAPSDKAPAQGKKAGADRITKWEEALNAYKSAIDLLAKGESALDDSGKEALENARANYEYVKNKLDQEKQNQQQNQQKKSGGGGGGDQQKKQQDKGDKDQDKKQPQDKQDQDKDKNQQQQGDKQDQDKDKDQQQKPQQGQQDKQQKPQQGDQDKQQQQPQPQPRDSQEQEQDQDQPQPAQGGMTKEEAEDLLDRLRGEQAERERKKLQKARRARKRRIVKDW